jgi:hypothetical protein
LTVISLESLTDLLIVISLESLIDLLAVISLESKCRDNKVIYNNICTVYSENNTDNINNINYVVTQYESKEILHNLKHLYFRCHFRLDSIAFRR